MCVLVPYTFIPIFMILSLFVIENNVPKEEKLTFSVKTEVFGPTELELA